MGKTDVTRKKKTSYCKPVMTFAAELSNFRTCCMRDLCVSCENLLKKVNIFAPIDEACRELNTLKSIVDSWKAPFIPTENDLTCLQSKLDRVKSDVLAPFETLSKYSNEQFQLTEFRTQIGTCEIAINLWQEYRIKMEAAEKFTRVSTCLEKLVEESKNRSLTDTERELLKNLGMTFTVYKEKQEKVLKEEHKGENEGAVVIKKKLTLAPDFQQKLESILVQQLKQACDKRRKYLEDENDWEDVAV